MMIHTKRRTTDDFPTAASPSGKITYQLGAHEFRKRNKQDKMSV